MTVTKKTVSECFAELRKFNYHVYNFNAKSRMANKSLVGFPDFMITGKGMIFFIEIKLYADKYSDEQLKVSKELKEAADRNPFVFYILATHENYSYVNEWILGGNYQKLKTLN